MIISETILGHGRLVDHGWVQRLECLGDQISASGTTTTITSSDITGNNVKEIELYRINVPRDGINFPFF